MNIPRGYEAALVEFLQEPVIAEITQLTRENALLAEIVLNSDAGHVTQSFRTANELRAAFSGELQTASFEDVDENTGKAASAYMHQLDELGISDRRLREVFEKVFVYSRLTHPVIELLEEVISEIQDKEATKVFGSGLAAIHACITNFVKPVSEGKNGEFVPGGKVVVVGAIYGGTFAQIRKLCNTMRVQYQFLPLSEFEEKGLPEDADIVLFEQACNPTLMAMPVDRLVAEAQRVGAKTLCDKTFMPFSNTEGVDFTLTSMTKYHNGMSSELGGCVSGSNEMMGALMSLADDGSRMVFGGGMGLRVAREYLDRLKDLPERLLIATQNAHNIKMIAENYGLRVRTVESFKHYEGNKDPRIFNSDEVSSGMMTLTFPTRDEAARFVDAMVQKGLGKCAVSLGARTTYYSIPAETTHSELSEEDKRAAGIFPGMVRISWGTEEGLVEGVEDLLEEMYGQAE